MTIASLTQLAISCGCAALGALLVFGYGALLIPVGVNLPDSWMGLLFAAVGILGGVACFAYLKRPKKILLVPILLAIAQSLSFWFFSDVVEDHYESLGAARQDNLFERGWLPDILPPSAHDIRTTNNLDLGISEGEFAFKPAEYPAFVERMSPYKQLSAAPYADFESIVAEKRRKGLEPHTLVEDMTRWVFFCNGERGRCEYLMWDLRNGRG